MSSSPLTPAPFHPRRPHLVAPVRIDPAGQAGPTPAMARTTEWRRARRGRYVPAWVDGSLVEQRIVEAAATLPAYAGVTGWAALRWLGGRWFTGTDASGELPVTLAVAGHAVRAQRGVVPSSERIGPVDLTSHDGLAVTTPTRSVCFEMRYAATLWLAVAALDMAAFSDLVSIAEVQSYADAHSGWTGIPQCREA